MSHAPGQRLGCWSCAEFRTNPDGSRRCARGRALALRDDHGQWCPLFDYDPGADEREAIQERESR